MSGSVEELAGLQTYITGQRDSKRAILFLSHALGFEAPNLRKLADKVAESGYFVVAPDFFDGDHLSIHDPQPKRDAWLNSHDAGKGCEDAKAVIEALKNMGFTAIGAAGFCWGGMAGLKLAKYDLVKAVVILHPGPITVDEINEVKVPTALLGAEEDRYCSAEHLKHLGSILATRSDVESMTKVYPGTKHGWTVTYSVEDEGAVKRAEEAHEDMLKWLNKYV